MIASMFHAEMGVHARIKGHTTNADVLTASPVKDVTSSPSSAHVRMVLPVSKVKEHTSVSANLDLPEGIVKLISTIVNQTHVKTVEVALTR